MTKIKSFGDYPALLIRVKKILIEGQARIEDERVKIYWETGRLIHDHILKHKDRAEYGGEVINHLAGDLNIGPRMLHYCVQFAKTYPRLSIVNARSQLTWSHYRRLMGVSDQRKRQQLEKTINRNAWSSRELGSRIREEAGPPRQIAAGRPPSISTKPLTPLRGSLYTYALVKRPILGAQKESALMVDLGFGIFHHVDPRSVAQFTEGNIIQSTKKDDAFKYSKTDLTAKDLFTYQAYVEKVIDGDTLKVRFDLGFDIEVRQTLRLRGLDCPEMDTKEGQAAKAFVQSYIKEAQMIIVRSSRSDKYDRYLADVFIPQGKEPDPQTDIYLNNFLLEKSHAVRMD